MYVIEYAWINGRIHVVFASTPAKALALENMLVSLRHVALVMVWGPV